MKKFTLSLCFFLIPPAISLPAYAAGRGHAEHISRYEGTATCTSASCHEGAAKEVAESLHYQQRAVPKLLEGWESGKQAGMTESY